jgi:hypothetical protein
MTIDSDEDTKRINTELSQLQKEVFGNNDNITTEIDNSNNSNNSSNSNNSNNSSNNNNNNINNNDSIKLTGGMVVIGFSMLGLVGLQFPFLFIKNAPYMASPSRKVRDALLHLKEEVTRSNQLKAKASSSSSSSSSQPPPVFVDLGSGDGHAVYEAAKLGYQSTGIEFNWTLWAFSSLRRQLFWSKEVKKRSQFLRQDFLSYNLKSVNTIMIFGVPRTMPILGKKIQTECSLGTNILSYRFDIPLASTSTSSQIPTQTSKTKNNNNNNNDKDELRLQANCIYNREEMKIYRMGR